MASLLCRPSAVHLLRCSCVLSRLTPLQKVASSARHKSSDPVCPAVGGLFYPLFPMSTNGHLVWVDLEMTGLDVDQDHIIEMACIITDKDLKTIAEGPDLVINQPDSVLDGMNDWCKEHHGKSGLTDACKASKVSLEEAETMMLKFVEKHTSKGACPLAGNTVHMDKRFLDKYMPRFMSHLHYRIVDVSTIKELCWRWYPDTRPPVKNYNHRAMEDIKQSIEELRFYQVNIFKKRRLF